MSAQGMNRQQWNTPIGQVEPSTLPEVPRSIQNLDQMVSNLAAAIHALIDGAAPAMRPENENLATENRAQVPQACVISGQIDAIAGTVEHLTEKTNAARRRLEL